MTGVADALSKTLVSGVAGLIYTLVMLVRKIHDGEDHSPRLAPSVHRVQAIHLTDVGCPSGQEDWANLSPAEQEFGQFIQQWWYTEGAYAMLHSTKPQTVGYALNDSPVGLAAWIMEKFYTWSDTKGDIENSFTKDELLTNVMIYWVTQTINTSIRTYKEGMQASYSTEGGLKSAQYVDVPTGVAIFPAEAPTPEEWANRMANVKRFTKMPKGITLPRWKCRTCGWEKSARSSTTACSRSK